MTIPFWCGAERVWCGAVRRRRARDRGGVPGPRGDVGVELGERPGDQVGGPGGMPEPVDQGGPAPGGAWRGEVVRPDVADGQQVARAAALEQSGEQEVPAPGLPGLGVHGVDDLGESEDGERLEHAGEGRVRHEHPVRVLADLGEVCGESLGGGDGEASVREGRPAAAVGVLEQRCGGGVGGDGELGDGLVPVRPRGGVRRTVEEGAEAVADRVGSGLRPAFPERGRDLVRVRPHRGVARAHRAVEVEDEHGAGGGGGGHIGQRRAGWTICSRVLMTVKHAFTRCSQTAAVVAVAAGGVAAPVRNVQKSNSSLHK
ncbi:hypothetical protein [Curtobacterium citreum]|uniref:hypothetical protein n=1 Tax=Curtobacterium citreum TaxID=2036 RepID=UPI002543758B|nr:hypothetical protein [Curtobacterium citreum]WIJ45416.1 hypothetical protein QPK07_00210 [Curtobacterium citreum]